MPYTSYDTDTGNGTGPWYDYNTGGENDTPVQMRRADGYLWDAGDPESNRGGSFVKDGSYDPYTAAELKMKGLGYKPMWDDLDRGGNRRSSGYLSNFWQDPSNGAVYNGQPHAGQWYGNGPINPAHGGQYIGQLSWDQVRNAGLAAAAPSNTHGGLTGFLDNGGALKLAQLALPFAIPGFGGLSALKDFVGSNLGDLGSLFGGSAGGAGEVLSGSANGGIPDFGDVVGSDWASGVPTGATGGLLPTTAGGLTAANVAGGLGTLGAAAGGLTPEQLNWSPDQNPTRTGLETTPGGMVDEGLGSNWKAPDATGLQRLADMGVPFDVLQKMGGGASNLSSLSKLFSGQGGVNDYAKLLGAGVDIFGANAARNRSNQLWDAGSDSRARFNAGMQPGFDINNIPGYKSALDTSTNAYLSKLSAGGGNPVGTGSSQAETQKYLMGSLGLPAWNNYQSQNANVGFGQGVMDAGTSGIKGLTSAMGQNTARLTAEPNDMNSTLGNLSSLSELFRKFGGGGDMFTTQR